MPREYVTPTSRRRDRPPGGDEQAQQEKERREEREREAEEREKKRVALEGAQATADAEREALEARIEGMLSSNPEEFVIRFLQTEGE